VSSTKSVDATELARSVHSTFFRAMVDLRRHYVKASPLTLTQTSILGLLAEEGPMRASELAVHEDVQHPTMAARIDRLESLGLVKRQRGRTTQRGIMIAVTAKGLRAHHEAVNDVLAEILDELTVTELRRLERSLQPLERLIGRARTDG
jgi:DNA-binding MarR family transcriptional regulator